MARNKRLHVELTIIKLNFLQQAIELSSENGILVKKKRIDGPIAIRTKKIPSIQLNVAATSVIPAPKLYIETPAATVTSAKPVTQVAANPIPIKPPVTTPKTHLIPTGNKKGLLDALREKYGDQYAIEEVKEAEVLKMEKLQSCWDSYTRILEQQLKHSSAGTFKIAKLAIEDDIHFTVTISSLTSQKFVEQERMVLIDHLQKAFNNRTIAFTVLVDAGEMEEVPAHLRMNSRQKYERIAEQYPLVKALKEKLKLEIDY